jgi:hypothetical protein
MVGLLALARDRACGAEPAEAVNVVDAGRLRAASPEMLHEVSR